MSQLICLGRHTVTGLLCTSGRQFSDWTADYRLFSHDRFGKEALFDIVRRGILAELQESEPLVVGLDDTLLRKRGTKTPGVKWCRDPLGPHFQVNLVRAQRIQQMSAAIPEHGGPSPARMIPIDFYHAPTPKRPKKDSTPQEWEAYRALSARASLPALGVRKVRLLREKMNDEGQQDRQLWIVADGGYTNRPFLKEIPDGVTIIGRIRGDARLYHLPSPQRQLGTYGRRRVYGERANTPESFRVDENIPWQRVEVFAAGKVHDFKVKDYAPLLWRASGGRPIRLIVIAPLGRRPRKKSKILYRKPAYLICTDLDAPIEKIIQAYIWRWDMEVNFKDEKHLLGVGEAQVRSEHSVENAPALAVVAYAMLLLAAQRAFGPGPIPGSLPPPKWYSSAKPRVTTRDLVQQLRSELWGKSLGASNFSSFAQQEEGDTKPQKLDGALASAVLYTA